MVVKLLTVQRKCITVQNSNVTITSAIAPQSDAAAAGATQLAVAGIFGLPLSSFLVDFPG